VTQTGCPRISPGRREGTKQRQGYQLGDIGTRRLTAGTAAASKSRGREVTGTAAAAATTARAEAAIGSEPLRFAIAFAPLDAESTPPKSMSPVALSGIGKVQGTPAFGRPIGAASSRQRRRETHAQHNEWRKDGVLTVTLPKTAKAQAKVKRIAINGKH